MKKKIKKIIIIALLAVVAFAGYQFFMKEKPTPVILQTDEVTPRGCYYRSNRYR